MNNYGFKGWTCRHCDKKHDFSIERCGCDKEIAYERKPFTRPIDNELRELVDFVLADNEDYQEIMNNSECKDPYDKDWHDKFMVEFNEAIRRRCIESQEIK